MIPSCLECGGIVESEVGKNFAVDFYAGFMDETHELRVGQILCTGGSVDTLNPQCAEIALFVLTVAVGIGKTFFPSVFCYSPHVAAAAEITTGEFEDFLSASS